MAEFTLDTSGAVAIEGVRIYWQVETAVSGFYLTPFQQGYVEGLFASLHADAQFMGAWFFHHHPDRKPGFSDLHPEALAATLKDCEARYAELVPAMRRQRRNGREFYAQRQRGTWPDRYPPITPYLDDAGRVCLKAAA